jgi:inosine-uridine nucleoside N-ribohydrolase
MISILLDTDIGSDIDDAVALSYLLKQPRCELLGITTVTGDVAKRCACAEVICRSVGRGDVPIHAGTSNVLLTGPG